MAKTLAVKKANCETVNLTVQRSISTRAWVVSCARI